MKMPEAFSYKKRSPGASISPILMRCFPGERKGVLASCWIFFAPMMCHRLDDPDQSAERIGLDGHGFQEEPVNHDTGMAGREQEREYSRGSDTSKSCRNE